MTTGFKSRRDDRIDADFFKVARFVMFVRYR